MPYARQARVMIELLLRMVDNVDYVEVRVCQCKRQTIFSATVSIATFRDREQTKANLNTGSWILRTYFVRVSSLRQNVPLREIRIDENYDCLHVVLGGYVLVTCSEATVEDFQDTFERR